tara:strand:+ start:28 stop:1050 length:1023 start_codon:yes stop_codon:yes gene_type:complete
MASFSLTIALFHLVTIFADQECNPPVAIGGQKTHLTTPLEYYDDWVKYVEQYSKQYESDLEYEKSYTKFIDSYENVINHTNKYYNVTMNYLADQVLPVNNLMRKRNSQRISIWGSTNDNEPFDQKGPMPDSWDWTEHIPMRVPSQGDCGSCWSFSAIGALESAYFLKYGKYKNFSESQLVDCSKSYGNDGCNGGEMNFAFEYLEDYGFETESDYPYVPQDSKCKYDKSLILGKIKSFVEVKSGVDNIKRALVFHGPLSIGIDASSWSFQLYHSGIYTNKKCSNKDLDHGVLLVGYGKYNGVSYWKVRNSWSQNWGIKGFVKINMETDCGISENPASYPVL